MIRPDKDTDMYRLRTAIFLFIYSVVALIYCSPIIQLFRVRGETRLELVAIILLVIPRFAGYFYFSFCGLLDIERLERRRRVFLLSMAVFASYLLLSGAIMVYHYFMHPDHLVTAKQFTINLPKFVADLFNVPIDYAAKTRIGLSRLAFTLNSFVLAGIFLYNIARFKIRGFTIENQLRMMCSLLIAIGMANILILSFNFAPFVGFLAIFLALWTQQKGYKLAFLQAILLALTSAGIGCGVFLMRDLFQPQRMEQVFMWTMVASFVIGSVSLLSYIIMRRRFYSEMEKAKNGKHH